MAELAREQVNDILEDIRDGIVGTGTGVGGISQPPAAAPATLLAAGSATGSWVTWSGGRGVAFVTGTFGGASATLQTRWNGGSPVSLGSHAEFVSAGGCGFELPAGAEIRLAIAGGTGVSLTAIVAHTGV